MQSDMLPENTLFVFSNCTRNSSEAAEPIAHWCTGQAGTSKWGSADGIARTGAGQHLPEPHQHRPDNHTQGSSDCTSSPCEWAL